ncbi:3-phenylpropionate-dihydrodiol/cinnamic acid-dihydrodiol dehydrogenase [Paraburkholderia fynbosensis]|uniref:3-phenylpropionate-dihydrodiol/cinnamic acid-dihydrodiol dehydrogenase n=1 Tax=Paraburkholderia fynbosensis TaxID=1200993 RepID=A0A6J5GZI9_9BURK|nr:3-phenylpropionate-dihydrodiol/cinnamic acid-dihydrodiol dehydrogenase [Paraburkholderia fynbosensis]
MRLANKTAIITGGSSGIGLATAQRFVDEGAYVFIVGRRQSELDKAVQQIGRNVTAVQADVTKLDDLDRMFSIVNERGKIDVLFANSGSIEHRTLDEITLQHYDATFDVNVGGVIFTMQKALPLMAEGSSVILTSSIAGIKGLHAHDTYSAARPPFARWRERGLSSSRVVASASMRSARGLLTHRSLTVRFLPRPKQPNCERSSPPRRRWDASAAPRKSRRPCCFSHPTTAASSPVPSYSSTVAWRRFNQ